MTLPLTLTVGGPAGPADTWRSAHRDSALLHRHELGIFQQLFDGAPPAGGASSTYTYLLGGRTQCLDFFGFATALRVAQTTVAKSGDYAKEKYGLEGAIWPPPVSST